MKQQIKKRGRNLAKKFSWMITIACVMTAAAALSSDNQAVTIIYPKANSLVGSRVNVVLDPATDVSMVPFFQAVVNNKTEYPVVDVSSGKHAIQGLALEQGLNTIVVRILAKSVDEKNKTTTLKMISYREIRVYNREGSYDNPSPAGYSAELFHSREHEAECSGCHRLEAVAADLNHKKPEDVLCFACHRNVPAGKHIHGPAAVWNCLGCHDPELYPVKYQFTSIDPWKVAKSTQTVEPMQFTIASAELFKPGTSVIVSKDKAKDLLKDVLNYTKQNPGDKIRLEVHTDNTPPLKTKEKVKGKVKGKVKVIGFKNNQALSDARAKTLASLLKESGIPPKSITAVGMGEKLPRAPNKTKDGKELNNRVEIVVHPADVKVKNSRTLPVLKDRDRVLVSLTYAQGPRIAKLAVIEKVPKGRQYLKGSGYSKGGPKEPRIKGDQLIWDLGDMDSNFAEALFYVLKKGKTAQSVPEAVKVAYTLGSRELVREFDPKAPVKLGLTVKEACLKCHGTVIDLPFKHGPADAGYCNLCHDPHASQYSAWLRKPTWDLCTTCHPETGPGVHVVAGFVDSHTHPTRLKRDPMRPGKSLSCASCHSPHSAENSDLFTYNVKTRSELCNLCHSKK